MLCADECTMKISAIWQPPQLALGLLQRGESFLVDKIRSRNHVNIVPECYQMVSEHKLVLYNYGVSTVCNSQDEQVTTGGAHAMNFGIRTLNQNCLRFYLKS